MLSPILVKEFSTDAPLSTNGVTSGGNNLFVPGRSVLAVIRALHLYLEVPSYYASSSLSVVPDTVTLVVADCMSDLVIVMNSLDCCIPSKVFIMVLTAPNCSNSLFSCLPVLQFHESNCSNTPEFQNHQFPFIFILLFSVDFIASSYSHCKREKFLKTFFCLAPKTKTTLPFSRSPHASWYCQ